MRSCHCNTRPQVCGHPRLCDLLIMRVVVLRRWHLSIGIPIRGTSRGVSCGESSSGVASGILRARACLGGLGAESDSSNLDLHSRQQVYARHRECWKGATRSSRCVARLPRQFARTDNFSWFRLWVRLVSQARTFLSISYLSFFNPPGGASGTGKSPNTLPKVLDFEVCEKLDGMQCMLLLYRMARQFALKDCEPRKGVLVAKSPCLDVAKKTVALERHQFPMQNTVSSSFSPIFCRILQRPRLQTTSARWIGCLFVATRVDINLGTSRLASIFWPGAENL
eukprot:284817951_5